MTKAARPDILADIGGTNARFVLRRDGDIGAVRRCAVADFPTPADAIRAFLADHADAGPPRRAAIAFAGPVSEGRARLTNSRWEVSEDALASELGLDRAMIMNDFAALAWALPVLGPDARVPIGGGDRAPDAPMAVLGPGTGLGVAAFVPAVPHGIVVATEGGHATMPAADDREAALLRWVRARHGHVSAERVLCGSGLEELYQAVVAVDGIAAPSRRAPEITERALAGDCSASLATLKTFCAMLGGFAGNVALTLGARGGVFIAGGIVPRFPAFVAASSFRERFEAKGRFRVWLAAVPTAIVSHPDPALLGLAAALDATS